MLRLLCLIAFAGVNLPPSADSRSPYAGQEAREIKSLSPQEVSSLLAGEGMGFAKAAELNGYPGPKHVLEHASKLDLTAEQVARTESVFAGMKSQAVAIGRELVREERELNRQFSAKAITAESLQSSLTQIAELQARLRQVHLQAHLEQTEILTDAQVAAYQALRGYFHDAGTHTGDSTGRH